MANVLKVAVGEAGMVYHIPKECLMASSNLVKEMLMYESAVPAKLEKVLEDIQPQVFEKFVDWLSLQNLVETPNDHGASEPALCHCDLTNGTLNSQWPLCDENPVYREMFAVPNPDRTHTEDVNDAENLWPNYCLQSYKPSLHTLVDLWKLANDLKVWKLQYQVVNLIMRRRKHLPITIFNFVYQRCPRGSPLRQLFVDMCCWGEFDCRLYKLLDNSNCLPQDLLLDVAMTEKRRRQEIMGSTFGLINPLLNPQIYYPPEFMNALSEDPNLHEEMNIVWRYHAQQPRSQQSDLSRIPTNQQPRPNPAIVTPSSIHVDRIHQNFSVKVKLRFEGKIIPFQLPISQLKYDNLHQNFRRLLQIPPTKKMILETWSNTRHAFSPYIHNTINAWNQLERSMKRTGKLFMRVKTLDERYPFLSAEDIRRWSNDVSAAPPMAMTHQPGTRKDIKIHPECSMCMEEIKSEKDAVWCRSQCGENFHSYCWYEWINRKRIEGLEAENLKCVFCQSKWVWS